MQIPLRNRSGKVVKKIRVSDALFGLPITPRLRGVIHQAVVGQRANARQGDASTKSRGEVAGSTRKLFPQKGTGRARQGSIRSPLRRHGGVAFGPSPRSYRQRMPKKMRRLALRGAFSSKASEGQLVVVDDLGASEPKTREMLKALTALGVTSSALVVTPEPREGVIRSARNLQGVKSMAAPYLNVLDLLTYDLLVMELGAVRKAEEIWAPADVGPGEEEEEQQQEEKRPKRGRKPGPKAAAPEASKAPTRRKRVARKPRTKVAE